MFRIMKKYFEIFPLELLFWISGLLILAFLPFGAGHLSLCPLKNTGFLFCPGCGLGLSVHHLFHFNIAGSFNANPLGIPAFTVIIFRIVAVSRFTLVKYSLNKRNYNG
jgi:hypothetical protein